MPELIALTAHPPDSSSKHIAINAVQQFEQHTNKQNAAYWDVTAASEAVDTVEKATGEKPVADESNTLLLSPIGTPAGERLVKNALRETVNEAQDLMTTLRDALPRDPDGLGRDIPDVTAKELLQDETFTAAAAELADPFGTPYRVFDLATHATATPIRSHETITELQNTYVDQPETLYVVKLLARRR